MRRFVLVALLTSAALASVVTSTFERGFAGAATTLSYAAIGDSITNYGVTAQYGWVNLYALNLDAELSTTTTIANLGVNGATSAQVLALISNDASTRSAIANAHLVTLEVGINDFFLARAQYINGTCGGSDNQDCLRATVTTFADDWDRLVSEIRTLAPSAGLRTMNVYYASAGPDEASGSFPALNSYLSQMNAHIAGNPGGPMADVHAVFNGPTGTDDPYVDGYLSSDRVHPGWLGAAVIAAQLQSLGYDGIVPDPPATPTASPTPGATITPAAPAAPAIVHAASDGTSTTVQASLKGAPSTPYQVNVYADAACDTSGATATLLGTMNATTDGLGDATATQVFNQLVPAGEFVLGTATLVPGGSTSAYSGCATVANRRCAGDSVCSGCPDVIKLDPNHNQGGQRDPFNPWDWYSVPYPALRTNPDGARSGDIGVTTDLVALMNYVGLTSDSPDYKADKDGNGVEDGLQYDRSLSTTPNQPWRSGPPDGGIGITTSVMAMLAQVGDTCAPPSPSPTPTASPTP